MNPEYLEKLAIIIVADNLFTAVYNLSIGLSPDLKAKVYFCHQGDYSQGIIRIYKTGSKQLDYLVLEDGCTCSPNNILPWIFYKNLFSFTEEIVSNFWPT